MSNTELQASILARTVQRLALDLTYSQEPHERLETVQELLQVCADIARASIPEGNTLDRAESYWLSAIEGAIDDPSGVNATIGEAIEDLA